MTTTAKPTMETRPTVSVSKWSEAQQTFSNALIITRREVRDSFRDWRILAPIIILTFLFPFLAQFVASQFTDFVTSYGAEIIGERTIPFLLMVVGFFPISISLVIALETFVGEKERRSLEPLLSTPLTNTELYIGKTLAAMIPPLVSSYGGMAVYLGSLLFGDLAWRPAPMLIIQIILLTTVQALVMVTGAVVVSSQTNSTRAANLLASFIIIPMTLVIQGESAIMFLAPDADSATGIGALWAIIAGMFVVVILLLRVGNSIFNREELLGSTIDQLNIRGIIRKIWVYFRAVDDEGNTARNPIDWYRRAIPYSMRKLKTSIMITVGVMLVAMAAGFIFGSIPRWQLPLPPIEELNTSGEMMALDDLITFSIQKDAFSFIVWQNGRVLLATLLLATFSFGVMALVLPPMTFAILGYLFSQVLAAGYDPMFMLGAVMTHGIIEIPTIVIATAIALRMGAVVTRPPKGETVGSVWLTTLGDTLKLAIAVVIPGLIIAGLIEAFITPQVVIAILGG